MTEGDNTKDTWGTLVGVVGGAALGYWAGRSANDGCGWGNRNCGGFGYGYGAAYPVAAGYNCGLSGFNDFEAGKTQAELTAGTNFTANGIGNIRRDIDSLSNQMNQGFQNIQDRQFQMLLTENQTLRGELFTSNALCPIKTDLALLNSTVSCLKQNQVSAFRAVPLCTTCPTAATTTTTA